MTQNPEPDEVSKRTVRRIAEDLCHRYRTTEADALPIRIDILLAQLDDAERSRDG